MSAVARLVRVVGLVLIGLCLGALPASADAGEPPLDPGADWTLTSSREDAVTADTDSCGTASEWVWTSNDREMTLYLVPCTNSDASSGVFEWLAPEGEEVFGQDQEGEVVLWAQDRLTRAWITNGGGDDRGLALLTLTCAGTGQQQCLTDTDALARTVMAATPGGIEGVDRPGFSFDSLVLAVIVPVVIIAIVIAPFRILAGAARTRYASVSTSPRYHDVSRQVTKARVLRLIRRLLWGVVVILVLVLMTGLLTGGDRDTVIGVVAMVLVPGALLAIGYRWWLRPSPVERGRTNVSGQGAEAVLGTTLSVLVHAFAALVLVTYLLLSVYANMLSGWPTLTAADARRMGLPLLENLRSFVLFLGVDGMLAATLLLIPTLILIAMADALAQRLRTASLDEALAQDTRPHYLYLRSFDEDKLSLVGQLRKRSPISALSLRRKVRFEEVMVRQLSATGPVIAIAPPGSNLPPIGAARASFSNDEWQQHVHRYAETARAVVLSATPGEIRQGYGWELDLVANRISHQRVLVVLGPWPLASLRRRWTQFCMAVSAVPFFAPITMPWVPDGIHVLAHSPQQGWQGWGARRRLDWTYAVAIDQATRAYLPDWS